MKDAKLENLKLKKAVALSMAYIYQPNRALYWNQIAKDYEIKIKKRKEQLKSNV